MCLYNGNLRACVRNTNMIAPTKLDSTEGGLRPICATFTVWYSDVALTYLLIYSMEQSSSWEAHRFSASQEIPCILWYQKVHYRIQKCPAPVLILSQIDPIQTPTSHFLKIQLYIIFTSTPGSCKPSLSLR